jgi:hypothetical protein
VTVSWNGICAPATNDAVRLYTPGGTTSLKTAFLPNGTASASGTFAIPPTVAAGTYELRLYSQATTALLATSNSFTVTR